MDKLSAYDQLQIDIDLLEKRKEQERIELVHAFQSTYENINPVTLGLEAISKFAFKDGITNQLLKVAGGMAAGYLTNKLFEGSPKFTFRKVISTLLIHGTIRVLVQKPILMKGIVVLLKGAAKAAD